MKLYAISMLGCAILSAQVKFTDVTAKHAAAQPAIQNMVSRGIIAPRSATEFAPDAPMTRAEFAVAMQKMFHLSAPGREAEFPDVPRGSTNYAAFQAIQPHFARQLLCFRCALGKNFLPNEPVTRAEMTMAMAHVMVAQNKVPLANPTETAAALAGVADGAKIPGPARAYFATAIRNNMVDLMPGKLMALPSPALRAEVALCLDHAQKTIKGGK